MPEPEITENGLWDGRMLRFASLPSTNSWATEHSSDCQHGDIILADDQTRGRGRFEREWSSAEGRSLTLSFVIDSIRFPFINRENYAQIAALGVWQLLGTLKIDALFKWPNDIMTERGKICGILAENISDTKVVVGIGINIALEHEEADLSRPFTSIHHEIEDVPPLTELSESLSGCLENAFQDCQSSGLTHLRETWEEHDYLKGKTITLHSTESKLTGKYAGINDEVLLLLEVGGEIREFHSGDVTLGSEPQ